MDLIETVGRPLERFGVITSGRFRSTIELAWPRIVTGFAIMSKQTADLAMVGIAVGTAGTAGLAFALAYWGLVVMLGLGLAGGTISLVSQNYGGDETERAALAVKQSVVVTIVLAVPIMAAFALFSESLIGLFDAEPATIGHGSVYLFFVAPAVLFEMLNLIASRTYTGIGDTFTEMVARSTGAALNIVLSALLIFGFGLGVAGAAIGTAVSTGVVTVVLAWGMLGRSYGGVLGMQPSPVPIVLSRSWIDTTLLRQLLEISAPEAGRRLAQGVVVFPLLWVAATFGPVVVTAFEVARRVRGLINSVNWGLSLAASSLVGQHLGSDDESEAGAYGASIIRLTLVIYIGIAIVVIALAEPISWVFVTDPEAIAQTTVFIAVAAVSAVGQGLDGAATGVLIGAGDTRLPFVAALIGRYAFALPIAALGLVTPLGVVALYLAFLVEMHVPGWINYGLFRAGRWKAVSRRYRTESEPG